MIDCVIKKMNYEDLVAVSAIHVNSLPNDYLSILGEDFLNRYFYHDLFKEANVALVSVDNGTITGYIFCISNKNFLRKFIIRNLSAFTKTTLSNLLNISFLKYSFIVIMLMLFGCNKSYGAELSYIAISDKYRGNGIGTKLVKVSLIKLQELNIDTIMVKTLSKTIEVVEFYKSLGFKVVCKRLGRVYLKRTVRKFEGG
jgi:ribosomal protein S18 acetylase RimI-like enzyme